jgi:sulfopropanediol 3-dehydrogenase
MPIEYLKKANPPIQAIDTATAGTVRGMLDTLLEQGEAAARAYARDLDGWSGDIIVDEQAFARAEAELSSGVKDDIRFARDRVQDFARRQRDSMQEFSAELLPGLTAGQRLIPCNTAGCYVPGGRYAHAASAIMSVGTASVAGVKNIIAATPAHKEAGIHPAILYAMRLCGVQTVLALGGVQGVAALAYGLFSGKPADIIVGPGNRFVAEAKRMLFGRVGIDVVAGPPSSRRTVTTTSEESVSCLTPRFTCPPSPAATSARALPADCAAPGWSPRSSTAPAPHRCTSPSTATTSHRRCASRESCCRWPGLVE